MMWSYDNSLTFELVLHETSRGGPAQIIFFCSLPCRPGFEPKSGRTDQLISLVSVRVGVVGNISACHADARGSIPRRGAFPFIPVSLVGQDIALSPRRPGFESRLGNTFLQSFCCKIFVNEK